VCSLTHTPAQSPTEIMAMFDKDGNGVLDKEEMKAFKLHWKNMTTPQGTASGPRPDPNGVDSGATVDANSGAVVSKQDQMSGCGGPGGFCCCRCGCPKGGRYTLLFFLKIRSGTAAMYFSFEYICCDASASALGERRSMERVELTLLRLESVMKDAHRDDNNAAGPALWTLEDDETAVVSGGSAGPNKRAPNKRNSVAPI
jgi:hypothetical protein